jgi:hypothetical protein
VVASLYVTASSSGAIAVTTMAVPGTVLLGVAAGECEARVEGQAMLMRGG